MAYQVIRVEKLKSAARVSGRLKHALRERVPEHVDATRLNKNAYFIVDASGAIQWGGEISAATRTRMAMARFRGLLPEKHRKDAVQAIEILVTASSKTLNHSDPKLVNEYLRESCAWVTKRFGGQGNVVAYAVHMDETTPHLSFFLVPRVVREKAGKKTVGLSAKAYIDGPKSLAQLQTDFHEAVAGRFNLQRGRTFSPATHMNIHEYYTLTSEVAQKVQKEREAEKQKKREEAAKRKDSDKGR